ncbi:hypothetical protein [[Eubacterium] hominis]|uniref:hypothetical protein n=1 Tax=[Eubacterium] hominis TaxID=2764325 RepID=UPI002067486E|nr:MAG TPA: hypothetical protein [Caudoviricetes sp.]
MSKYRFGVCDVILRELIDRSNVHIFNELQKAAFESSFSAENVTGGNRMFPLTSWPKDKSVKLTFDNAACDVNMIHLTEGAITSKASKTLMKIMEVLIPTDGVITLDEVPTEVLVEGFKVATADTPAKGEFKLGTADKTVTFAPADAGTSVKLVYSYNSGADSVTNTITEGTKGVPFEAFINENIYNENNEVVGTHNIHVYKMQCTTGTKIDTSHQTPTVESFEAEARDPKRTDKALWEETYDWFTK